MKSMTLFERTTRLWDRVMDGALEPATEAAFQAYVSPLPARGLAEMGHLGALKFAVTSPTVQQWLDRRWHGIVSEIEFLAENVVGAGDVVVECAAGYGLRSIALATLIQPHGRLISFEPEPQQLNLLRHNLRLNALPNLTAEALALGGTPGIATYHRDRRAQWTRCSDCTAGLPDASCWSRAAESFHARVVTLDEYVRKTGLDPDVLVIDADGEELEVLKGASMVLGRAPKLWIALDPEAPGRHRCSLVELGQVLDLSQYDWSIISRKSRTSQRPGSPAIPSPSYMLGVPRPTRYALSGMPPVGTHPTGTPLESYSR